MTLFFLDSCWFYCVSIYTFISSVWESKTIHSLIQFVDPSSVNVISHHLISDGISIATRTTSSTFSFMNIEEPLTITIQLIPMLWRWWDEMGWNVDLIMIVVIYATIYENMPILILYGWWCGCGEKTENTNLI